MAFSPGRSAILQRTLMPTIIVGDGLTNEYLSPEPQYRGHRRNVGQQEISRLLGAGKEFGAGPLPLFLRQAVEVHRSGGRQGGAPWTLEGNRP